MSEKDKRNGTVKKRRQKEKMEIWKKCQDSKLKKKFSFLGFWQAISAIWGDELYLNIGIDLQVDRAEHKDYTEAFPKEHLDLVDIHERRILANWVASWGEPWHRSWASYCCNQSQIERQVEKQEDYLVKWL